MLAIAVIWTFFSVLTDGAFVSPRNLSNLLRQMSITGMLACGMVFVIISGEIDLSVGSLLGLLGGVAAILDVTYHWPLAATLPAVMVLGVAIGLFNGWWSTYLRVPSFIVGLGGMLAYRGVLLGITGGSTIAPVSDDLVFIGQGYLPRLAGDTLAIVLFVLLAVLTVRQRAEQAALFVTCRAALAGRGENRGSGRRPGCVCRHAQSIRRHSGARARVAWPARRIYVHCDADRVRPAHLRGRVEPRSDAPVGRQHEPVKLAIFALMGLMCAFGGLVNTARLAAGSPSAGSLGELDAIAACFIGGTSMRGGSGTVYGALIGALVMASLDNGMSMLDVDSYWQMIVKGAILVLAVWIDVVSGSNQR